jgi:hypothetical protein
MEANKPPHQPFFSNLLAVHLVGEAGDADADIPKRLFEPHGVRLPEGRGPNSFAKA